MIEIATTIKNEKLVQKRRKQIILAAIKLFSQKGFHKATLRELSKVAKISHGNIYDYVSNKEDIFFLIHEFIANTVNDELDKIMKNVAGPVQRLKQMIKVEFEFMNRWADAILLIYQETHILNKIFLKKLLKSEREHVSKYEGVLKELTETGVFRDFNIRCIANLIKIMLDSWVLKRWDLRGHVNRTEMESHIIDLLLNGMLKENAFAERDLKNVEELKENHQPMKPNCER